MRLIRPGRKHLLASSAAVAVVLGFTANYSFAAVVLSRPALQVILGGPGTLEDFEAYNIGAGNANVLNVATLDNTSIANGQGPGLVGAGVTYISNTLQWNGAGYYSSPSKELIGDAQPFTVDFNTSVGAFGVDLRAFDGYPATAQLDVYATNDLTLIGTLSGISLSSSGVPVFAGWQDVGGIGKIVLTQSDQGWAPIIDNLEYGRGSLAPVPELSSVVVWSVLVAVGAAVTRRKLALRV